MKTTANKLINETSPYLLQHAYNAVMWYPWGPEALELAKQQDKPIFLSIGYSSCHWCHVMEHESFNDEKVAKILNDNFINIKVDREERPDIDEIYMKATQIITRHGGWPMSVFLTPDCKPFYAGTYFPPVERHSMPSFTKVIETIIKLFQNNRQDVDRSSEEILEIVKELDNHNFAKEPSDNELNIQNITAKFLENADFKWGGFGYQPKFPSSPNLNLLLDIASCDNNQKLHEFLITTLDKIALGGINDQLSGGFARYSTDNKWYIPHFEKMLYDNSQLISIYLKASKLFKNDYYQKTAIKTIEFVDKYLKCDNGGVYSSIDADFEGHEGQYYTFTYDTIKSLLTAEEFDFCLSVYDIKENGNFENGRNALYLNDLPNVLAQKLNLELDDFNQKLDIINSKILHFRQSQDSPNIDIKIIASLNSLMVIAYIDAFLALGDEKYKNSAIELCDFILTRMFNDNIFYHCLTTNKLSIRAFLDDWTYLIWSLLKLDSICTDNKYLSLALKFLNRVIEEFYFDDTFYYTSKFHEKLIVKPKNIYDSVYPSGLSVLYLVLTKAFKITNNPKYDKYARNIFDLYAKQAFAIPQQWGYLLSSIWQDSLEDNVLIIPDSINYNNSHYDFLFKLYKLNKPVLTTQTISGIDLLLNNDNFIKPNILENKTAIESKPTLYCCLNFTCQEPINDIAKL